MHVLFEHSEQELWNQMKFQAGLQGVDLEKAVTKNAPHRKEIPASDDGEDLRFKSKEDYAKMTPEERKEKTQKMLKFFKAWARETPMEKGRLKKHGSRK